MRMSRPVFFAALLTFVILLLARPPQAVRAGTQSNTAASGSVLASDNFSNAASGLLPASATQSGVQQGYVNGEYQMQISSPEANVYYLAPGQQDYSDVTIAVDARVVPPSDGSSSEAGLVVGCRFARPNGGPPNGYRFAYFPTDNHFELTRLDAGKPTSLTNQQPGPGPLSASTVHHLQLTCAGQSLSASIDGMPATTQQDATYTTGRIALGIGIGLTPVRAAGESRVSTGPLSFSGTEDARFTNLVISQP
jgi:hypothetical protein